ncbi:corticosteroid-binding protein [Nasonia vitripennis]|uniref:Amine oxidase domain-containing protein n=1 Tax=Nasonia vitripennis TaxID=7425 RepID=A0A7M7TAJ8_NASVI|nr:corticosteroid-binding protein [Nasonia vitripennis]
MTANIHDISFNLIHEHSCNFPYSVIIIFCYSTCSYSKVFRTSANALIKEIQEKVEANNFSDIKSVENAKIVIIGAGVSGIAAASKLFENGFKEVKILEAGNRIGGRIFTTQFGGYEVDLGAQWVHGENGNAVFDLAWPLNLLDKPDGDAHDLYYFDSNGTRLNNETEEQLRNFYFDYLFEESDTGFESYGEYVKDAFNRKFGNALTIYKDRKKYLNSYKLNRLAEEGADSWFEISAQPIELYTDYPGTENVNWKTRGYSTLLDYLIKRYPNPQEELPVVKNTLLNSEVVKINYLNRNEGLPILITTKNRTTYEADHVIMTASIGVLKAKHSSLFIPRLPQQITETIKGFAFGRVGKVYLLFKKPFWQLGNKKNLQFSFLWSNTERRSIEKSEKNGY